MFSKTRKKIVLTTALALILFLAVTLGVIYVSSWLSVNRQNEEMLERYIGLYSLESLPGENFPGPPPGGDEGGVPEPPPDGDASDAHGAMYQLSSFYSAAFSEGGEVLAVDAGRNGLYTKEQIEETARSILAENKTSGSRRHLLYRVEKRDDYTLVAFMDMTLTDNSMGTLLIYMLLAGALGICILTGVSVWLARRIVEPLEENDRKQRQFISDAGHELKTPVAVISANAEILERQAGRSEWLDNIQYENRRMGELVTGLLDLSRAEGASYAMESVDLSRLVEREVLPFESVAFEEGLMIDSHIGQGIRVSGNPAQLRQLVSILADNAIRHGKGGDTVRVLLESDRKNARLAVVNRGDIPREKMERLFDRFYRADEARTDAGSGLNGTGGGIGGKGGGKDGAGGGKDGAGVAAGAGPASGGHYGLGLAIAKAIAESHGGRIGVTSAGGEVRFEAELPLEKQRGAAGGSGM